MRLPNQRNFHKHGWFKTLRRHLVSGGDERTRQRSPTVRYPQEGVETRSQIGFNLLRRNVHPEPIYVRFAPTARFRFELLAPSAISVRVYRHEYHARYL
jgi:hypothetical protein